MWRTLTYRLRWSVPFHRLRRLWYGLRFYAPDLSGGQILFLLMLAAPIGMLIAIICFAWLDNQRIIAEQQRVADLICLARNVYHEARGEPAAGQHAVAEVTMNRVASPLFPATVCEVVHAKRAFSWTELYLDARPPGGVAWQQAVAAAEAVYDGNYEPVVGNATHYHATYVAPRWARGREPVARIGRHVFYE